MKKLLFAVCLVLSVAAYAQEDTAAVVVKQGDPDIRQTSDQLQESNLKDMAKITSAQLPEPVKAAIKNAHLRGTQTYYKHKEKDEYAVETKLGEVSSFLFYDKNGQSLNRQR